MAEADLCVKCGLCLPHCPTYLDSRHEADSPRGRISLIQALGTGLIQSTSSLEAHLDGCLSCRRCEVVCPANVPFSRILDAGRAQLATLRPERTRTTRLLAGALTTRAGRIGLGILLSIYRRSGLQAFVRRFHLLGRGTVARLESLVPEGRAALPPPNLRPAIQADAKDAIAVFHGCATHLFEREALRATEILLGAAGYDVQPAPAQTCCGALHQHGGMPDAALDFARRNLGAFAAAPRIATLTTGCAATLRDYAGFGLEDGLAFAARVKDFADWLLPRRALLSFRPLPLRAAIHTPCTALNVMKSDTALRTLLACIPQLELIELDPTQRCCGAAGVSFVTQPGQSDRLLQPKLDAIARIRPDFIISGNVGCSLHLAGGLTRAAWPTDSARGMPAAAGSQAAGLQAAHPRASVPGASLATAWRPPVRHPAQVLAEQLERLPPRS